MNKELEEIYKQGAADRCAELQVNPEANAVLAAIQQNPGALHTMGDFAGGTALFPKQASAAEPTEQPMQNAYAEGLVDKLAEHGVGPEMLKQAGIMDLIVKLLGRPSFTAQSAAQQASQFGQSMRPLSEHNLIGEIVKRLGDAKGSFANTIRLERNSDMGRGLLAGTAAGYGANELTNQD